MGSWGFESLQNDDSLEIVDALERSEGDPARVIELLRSDLENPGEWEEITLCYWVIGAAEAIACWYGNPGPRRFIPEEVLGWAETQSSPPAPALVQEACDRVQRVRDDSDLCDHMASEPDDIGGTWRAAIDSLIERLRAAPSSVAPVEARATPAGSSGGGAIDTDAVLEKFFPQPKPLAGGTMRYLPVPDVPEVPGGFRAKIEYDDAGDDYVVVKPKKKSLAPFRVFLPDIRALRSTVGGAAEVLDGVELSPDRVLFEVHGSSWPAEMLFKETGLASEVPARHFVVQLTKELLQVIASGFRVESPVSG